MQTVANQLQYWLKEIPLRFSQIGENEASLKPAPGKWSKKEILGHLCDSALHNLQRFIKAHYEAEPVAVQRYVQDEWVALQRYQNKPAVEILTLWTALNQQIASVIENVPDEKLSVRCDLFGTKEVTLSWLIEDYLQHLEHHVNQLFSRQ